MKFVTYDGGKTGVLKGDSVVDVSSICTGNGQVAMEFLISNYDSLVNELTQLAMDGAPIPLRNAERILADRYNPTPCGMRNLEPISPSR